MKLIEHGGTIYGVELTRRNLTSLLAKLDGHPPNSACSIQAPGTISFYVKAVDDFSHYGERVAGLLHEATEQAMKNYDAQQEAGNEV